MKICKTCKIEKIESEFNKNYSYKDGLCPFCKTCRKERRKQQHKNNPWIQILISIKQRCYNPKNKRFKCYGGFKWKYKEII